MSASPFQALACPIDQNPLQFAANGWQCHTGHRYDCSRDGYINLLPVQHKRSRDPGDSKPMVSARHDFLEAGYYRAIAETISRQVLAIATPGQPLACLDAGCGEGYYLRQLACAAEYVPLQLLGVDISKWAIQAAARRDRQSRSTAWVVASNNQLPVVSHSLDVVLCGFGFPVFAEFERVLKPHGHLLMVDAGPDHLRELRDIIYPEQKQKPAGSSQISSGSFKLEGRQSLQQIICIPQKQIINLLTMTPHGFRSTSENQQRATALEQLEVTLDVQFSLFSA